MARFLKALILLPVAIVVVLLAVANRGPVTISFDPTRTTSDFSFTLPLFAVLFAAVVVGVVIGGIGSWLGQRKHRNARRRHRREAERLRAEAERLRAYASGQPGVPALPAPSAARS
jgi:uncharacterized integral membrane protein